MTSFISMLSTNDTFTNNGAVTNSTSSNFNLDLFFLAGACRRESEESIENVLVKSYSYDRVKTLKIIFWAGDIRQGAGERRFFKLALNWLYKNHKQDLYDYLQYVPEFSRWDVLFDFADDSVILNFIIENLQAGNGLLCKWLPRKNFAVDKKVNKSSSKKEVKDRYGKVIKSSESSSISVSKTKRSLHNGIAHKIMKAMNLTPKQYRKMLVEGTKVVEQKMCAKKWNEIEYSKVPSVAMNKYNKAWYRNDGERFTQYLESVKKGEEKINASAIFPHTIIAPALHWRSSGLNQGQITQWENLPNWLDGKENSIIPVCDVSGSMTGTPMEISVGLGLYISERNVGPFKDAFITFSSNPSLQYLKGDINERIHQLTHADWGMSTNLVGVFELILRKARETMLAPELMPQTILVISDMEFNACGELSNYETIKQAYSVSGYECPNIVFWNVNGRTGNVPVKMNSKGVALISGASPSIIRAVLNNEINPITIMDKAIECERYSFIK